MQSHRISHNSNESYAQETGVNLARGVFKEGCYGQGIMFSWDRYPSTLNNILDRMKESLTDASSLELSKLCKFAIESYDIELSNLKEKYIKKNGSLPIEIYDDLILIDFLVASSTEVFVHCYPNEFLDSLIAQDVVNAEQIWQDLFVKRHTVEKLRNLSMSVFEDKLWNTRFTAAIQEAAIYDINKYWKSIKNSSEILD